MIIDFYCKFENYVVDMYLGFQDNYALKKGYMA